MRKNGKKKCWFAFIVAMILFTGCSAKNDAGATNNKQQIVVATSGAPKPFSYVDEANELTGYDIAVVKAIFEELPEYDLTFEKTEFSSVLAGLDTDRYQIGANNFAMNEERKEKYIYSDPIFANQYTLAVAADRTDIKGFADLKGLSTEVTPGLNYATALENYNREYPDTQINIAYSEAELLNVLQNVESGKYDFQLIDKAMGQQFIDEHQLKLSLIELSTEDAQRIGSPYSYLLLSKTEQGEKLAEEINQALQKAIDKGTVSEISKTFLGGDFSPK